MPLPHVALLFFPAANLCDAEVDHHKIVIACQTHDECIDDLCNLLCNVRQHWELSLGIFKDQTRFANVPIGTYGSYKSYGLHKAEGGDSSSFPEFSGRILDLKEVSVGGCSISRNLSNQS